MELEAFNISICYFTVDFLFIRMMKRVLISMGLKGIVIQSRQLAPGVGGYAPSELFEVLSLVRSAETPVLLSTACKCHGVINAFEVGSKRNGRRQEK